MCILYRMLPKPLFKRAGTFSTIDRHAGKMKIQLISLISFSKLNSLFSKNLKSSYKMLPVSGKLLV